MRRRSEPEALLTTSGWRLVCARAGRKGTLDDGSDYLWRMDAYGEPEVQIWRESKLDSTHEPFWYTADGEQEVRLTNPYDLAVNHDEL